MKDEKKSWWDKFTSIGVKVNGNDIKLFPFVLFALACFVFIYMNLPK